MLRNSPTALRLLKCALNAADDGHAGIQARPCPVLQRPNAHLRALLSTARLGVKTSVLSGAWWQRHHVVLPK